MKLIKINRNKLEEKKLLVAARKLKEGGLVIFPTETVYGLGANAENKSAVSRVYKVKKRPAGKPLSLHISDLEIFYDYLKKPLDQGIQKLIRKFWPGPLTLVVETGRGKKGFRMPNDEIVRKLIELSEIPVVAPSANVSGEYPPKSCEEISKKIRENVEVIIDGGRTGIGIESTVVDTTVSPYKVLRKGALGEEKIKEVAYNGRD